ncbi:serine/threonine-protein kinase MARK1-like [Talpa occidentalis]|uniref:serine/threonine-protein kinase MARK1-like n=1 Tax=Talpa occidentalis TaxID=50954 RepID=UPI0023F77DCA|nr:serine/threonine-protein kinase MARK1-like [Talpa occidentalis]
MRCFNDTLNRAPELSLHQWYIGPRVDVWCLGVMLDQMVTGTLPFRGTSVAEIRQHVLGGLLYPPFYLSVQCRDLLSKMLALDPQRRSTLETLKQHPWVEMSKGLLPFSEPSLSHQDRRRRQSEMDCSVNMAIP